MPTPRLVQVACPQCGAGMRIDPKAQVVTCEYCKLSSFVQLPHAPPPPAQAGYGNIQVPAKALRTGVAAVSIVIAVLAILTVAAGAGFFLAVASPRSARQPASPSLDAPGGNHGPASEACNRAVACCKAVMSAAGTVDSSQKRACEGLRVMSDADCAKQYDTFRSTARELGRRCD